MSGARARRRGIVLAMVAIGALRGPAAVAQTDADLAAARKTFAEAVGDENAKRFDAALEKFRRVASVKDTANVRYRIASCLEALGRQAEALTNYEAAVKLGEQDKASADVVHAASTRAAALDRVVPRLTIVVPDTAPGGTEVRVDDGPVEKEALGSVKLDPGHHTIAATAPNRVPYQTGVTLPEGARVSITVDLAPIPGAAPASASTSTASPTPTPAPTSGSTSPPGPPSPDWSSPVPAESRRHSPPAAAYVFLGLGGVLAAGSVVSFVLRQSNLDTLNRDCQTVSSGHLSCQPSRQGEVNSAHDAAKIEGPLGIGLAAGAVAALGAGVWMIAATPHRSVGVTPVVTSQGGMLVLTGRLER